MTLALENKYADKVNFIIANVDTPQGKEIARTFNVYTIPSYYFIGNKKIILHSEGKVERLALEEQIQYLIKQNK